jgi:XTP/dITP diphosphohydrolase
MRIRKFRYATSSSFKREEVKDLLKMSLPTNELRTPMLVEEAFDCEFHDVKLEEPLERDLETMVRHKVMSAYRQVMAPCVVEHAAIIMERFQTENYPGGLTQPMWDAVGPEGFVKSVSWAGSRAIARCLVAYTNGKRIVTFVGDTYGTLADGPRTGRAFYWDTVFCPDSGGDRSYSEIAAGPGGIREKMKFSQSTKAFMDLFEYLLSDKDTMFSELE